MTSKLLKICKMSKSLFSNPLSVCLLQCTYKKEYIHILYIVYLDDNLKAGLIYGTWKVSAHHRLESDSSKKCVSQRTFVADNHRKIFNLDCVTRLILNWIRVPAFCLKSHSQKLRWTLFWWWFCSWTQNIQIKHYSSLLHFSVIQAAELYIL